MPWQQLKLTCPASDLELVEDLLLELGALSLSLGDAADEPIFEPLPGDTPVWSESIVTATFDESSDPERLAQALLARLPASIASTLIRDSLQERDWEQAYRDHFKPLQCADRLWIVPSWIDPPDAQAVNLRLDPGLAFGTGSHPTTALCLAWLAEQQLADLDLVDYGCGSGILAIAAIMLGARQVLAVDIDPQAIDASRANMERNAIAAERITLYLPQEDPGDITDLLMANILAGPLIELAPQFASRVRPGGKILLSGILISQVTDIQFAYGKFFQLDPARHFDEWACISGQRREP